jgi:hypothetical protein
MSRRTAAVLEALPWAAAEWDFHQAQPPEPAAEPPPTPDSPLTWAQRYRQIDGQPFSLARFAPLQALYADPHPHIVVIKPAQRGVSEWAINYAGFALDAGAAAWAPEKDGLNVAYLFPTAAALGDFSKERFSGLRHETPYLANLFGEGTFDAVTFKQVRSSYLYLRGGWSESALLSFAADVLVLDEYDRMDPKAVALARRRLNASVVRRELDISTPTLPGTGIHGLYLESDQRVYEQRCPHCSTWQVYDFFRDVRADGVPHDEWQLWSAARIRAATVAVHCPACTRRLTTAARCAPGRWVAQAPEIASLRGYWMPPLAWPFVDLTAFAIAATSANTSEVTEFYRSDLGLPYEAGGARITEAMLLQLAVGLPGGLLPAGPWRDVTMGVDVGARWHYRISATGPDGDLYVLAMGTAHRWEDLDVLLAQYAVRQCVVDALPEQHGAEAWAAKHPGRILRAFYPQASALAGQLYRVDEKTGRVQINRTMAMDGVQATVATAAEHWPAAIVNDPEVLRHLQAPVRVVRLDAHGQEQPTWVHTQPDHYFHAAVYDQIARAVLPPPPRPFSAAAGGERPGVQGYQPR